MNLYWVGRYSKLILQLRCIRECGFKKLTSAGRGAIPSWDEASLDPKGDISS
jgi:hypothetical protein